MAHMYSIVAFGGLLSFAFSCDRYSGPSGLTECVQLYDPGYNAPQYVTCLTDTYIQLKSGDKRHQCRDRFATYCYYQCMCELNNECNGPEVYKNCTCDPNDPNTNTHTITLSPQCFSPSGEGCSWYAQCLEKRYPCKGTAAASAITYANKFCDLHFNHSQKFSSDGRSWIDAFRKCLQVELVPTLRPYVRLSCDDIKHMAFASHTQCYTRRAPSNVSFCSLDRSDRWKVFWTIKGAFSSAFVETMIGLRDSLYECITGNNERFPLENDSDVAMTQVYVRRPVSMDQGPDLFAGKTIDAIAIKEKWLEQGLAWFAYSGDSEKKKRQVTPATFRIDILLSSRQKYDLNSPETPVVNMTETVSSFANFVKKGISGLKVNGTCVHVVYMKACSEFSCNSAYLEARLNGTVTCSGSVFRVPLWSVIIVGITAIVQSYY